MTLPETIPFLGIGWDDALFMGLATVLLVAGLLVVTMRDIIRCALAMIVCFAALAGLYVMASAPFVAAAEVLVYIGAISVLVLFAIMLTQTKAAPSRLVFQTQARPAAARGRAAGDHHRARGRLDRLAGGARPRPHRAPWRSRRPCSARSSCRSRSSASCCWRP